MMVKLLDRSTCHQAYPLSPDGSHVVQATAQFVDTPSYALFDVYPLHVPPWTEFQLDLLSSETVTHLIRIKFSPIQAFWSKGGWLNQGRVS